MKRFCLSGPLLDAEGSGIHTYDTIGSLDEAPQMSLIDVQVLTSRVFVPALDNPKCGFMFVNLVIKESDDNVKLIVPYRLDTVPTRTCIRRPEYGCSPNSHEVSRLIHSFVLVLTDIQL